MLLAYIYCSITQRVHFLDKASRDLFVGVKDCSLKPRQARRYGFHVCRRHDGGVTHGRPHLRISRAICLRTISRSTRKLFSYSFGALGGTYWIAERQSARPDSGRVTRALASTFGAPNFF